MRGHLWRFAGFEYSPMAGLKRDGQPIPIGPQARQLLELLLHSNGAVVSKAEIAAQLWPGRLPSDDSIDRCAYLLRKPLRDAGGGDVVATVYGRGLSLRARIEIVDPNAGASWSPASKIASRVSGLRQTAYELSGSHTCAGFESAQKAIEQALAADPDCPEIRTLSAEITIARAMRGFIGPARASEMIEANTDRALAFAPDYPPALAARGWARATLGGALQPGLDLLDRAIERDGFNAKARLYRGWARAGGERLEAAISDIDVGLDSSPLDQALLAIRAWMEVCSGNPAGGEKRAQDGLKRRPGAIGLVVVASIGASLLGRHREAISLLKDYLQSHPADPVILGAMAYAQAAAGMTAEARETFAELDKAAHVPSLHAAAALLAMGCADEATDLLALKSAEACPCFVFASQDPRLAELRPEIARLRSVRAQGQG